MSMSMRLSLIAWFFVSIGAHSQESMWSDEQRGVWEYVKLSWISQVNEDGQWPNSFSHEKLVQWADSEAAPRDRDAYNKWSRDSEEAGDITSHEITPLAINIEGNTAVVGYTATIGFEGSDGETGTANRNIFEVLIRDGGSWQYLASVDFTPNHED